MSMIVEYTGRKTAVTPKLKQLTEEGLARIERVTNRCTSAHIILTEDKYRHIAEITVQCRNESLVASCEATDMEQALREALAAIEKQAVKSKERFTTVRSHPKPVQALSA
ncbi:MAG TPA: ribosome-associated translation inhibitor RaiA [Candidatus Aquilonibacter sp.]|nr:ribosome-associated translation inhibitor RaiA [Candidatus Aquilonibacter sp.]